MAKDSDKQGDTNATKDAEPSEAETTTTDDDEEEEEDDDQEEEGSGPEDSDDEEEDEPKLKYARLTSYLGPVYRNGDATSAFLG